MTWPRTLTILAGAATMVYGTTVMLVKPDIKGALAHSTTAQMGFMILTCGLGLWAAAVIHLVAHGFYKATLFLSSGSAISRHRRHEPCRRPRRRRAGSGWPGLWQPLSCPAWRWAPPSRWSNRRRATMPPSRRC